ncbi:MAG TPA: hypothetical protein VE224_05710 [Pseudolabrys sp.]|nr:hypothetical protein [Pseudolabrys sp.]
MGFGSYEGFARHINESFQVGLGASSVEMTLVRATKGTPRDWEGLRKEPFSLFFKCATPVILPQRMYPFANDGFGRMDIFIVPIGRERDGIVYQAVFN